MRLCNLQSMCISTQNIRNHIYISTLLCCFTSQPEWTTQATFIYSHNKMEHFQASFTNQISQQFTDQHYFAAAKTTNREQIIYVHRYTDITFYEMKKPRWALTECFQISAELTWSNSAELIPASNLSTIYQPYDWEKKNHIQKFFRVNKAISVQGYLTHVFFNLFKTKRK